MIRWKLLKVLALILGIVSLALCAVVFTGSVGYREAFLQYGGDAYTGMQNAAAQTANNVMYLGQTIRMALAFFRAVQGLGMIFFALCIRTKQPAPAPVPAPVVMPQQSVYTAAYQASVAPQQPENWICPHCGTSNAADYLFCQGCGKGK